VIPASPCCATTPRSTKDWVTSPKHFWRVLPKSLPLPSKRAGEAIRWFASKLKPQVDYDLADQILGITLGTSEKPETKGLALLTDVLNIIDRMAAAAGRRGAVILDEFQQIIEEGGATAERQIRGTVQTSTVIFSVRASCEVFTFPAAAAGVEHVNITARRATAGVCNSACPFCIANTIPPKLSCGSNVRLNSSEPLLLF
jgi:hypothetical protein